jgi:hypothetical protein
MIIRVMCLLVVLVVAVAILPSFAAGQQANVDEERTGSETPTQRLFVGFPDADFYPHYLADPLRAQSALMLASVLDSEIPESGNSRFILRLGGRYPLFRMHPEGEPDRGLQLDFEGGFFAHFDRGYSLDNIGWDGIFGLLLSWKPNSALAFRAGTLHDSAHVGDEYGERTGRTRKGYTREEFVVGTSWIVKAQWRVYAEGGYGFNLEDFQEPLRLQGGIEFTGQRRYWKGRAQLYAAVDLGAYEETSWELRSTVQAGFMIPTEQGHRYRLALEFCNGRSTLGEFGHRNESYIGLGWYFDF